MIEIIKLGSVASLDDPDATWHRGVHDVAVAISLDKFGSADFAMTPGDIVGFCLPNPDSTNAMAVALADGVVVGYAYCEAPNNDNLNLAELNINVHPNWRRQGVGTQLLAWASQQAVELGRTTCLMYVQTPPPTTGQDVVDAPPGGQMAVDHSVAFALKHGYSLEQIDRVSHLSLPVDAELLATLLDQAASAATGYSLHIWQTPLPSQWLDSFAALRSRVTIDAPQADIDVEQEVWDADRLARVWEENTKTGDHSLVVAAEDDATGQLIAFTQVYWNDWRPDMAWQAYTFVRADHRGHRLGLLIKATMLGQLAKLTPAITRIYTENATENSFMLSVNQAIGYQLFCLGGTFQKKTA